MTQTRPNLRNGPLFLGLLLFFLLPATRTFAEPRVFVEQYTYQASEADSKISSRAIALEQVKRLLLEKLGVYLESETEVRNFRLTKDQIVTLTAGIVRAEIIDEKWDGRVYLLKAKLEADPSEVSRSVEKLRQDREKTKELEETRRKADEALKEIENLKKELETAKGGKRELDRYEGAVKRLSAVDWLTRGFVYSSLAEQARAGFEDARKRLQRTKALYDVAAATAGMVQEAQAQEEVARAKWEQACQRAIEAYTSVIALAPDTPEAYYHRGLAHDLRGDRLRAAEDQETAARMGYKPAQDLLRSKGKGR